MTTLTATPEPTLPATTRRREKRLPWGSPVIYFVALVVIALMLAPIAYIVLGGFRTNSQITVDPAGFPNPWNVGNYLDVLGGSTFWQEVLNSTIVAVVTTIAFKPRPNISVTNARRSCCHSGNIASSPAAAQTRSSKARWAAMSMSPNTTRSTPRAASPCSATMSASS